MLVGRVRANGTPILSAVFLTDGLALTCAHGIVGRDPKDLTVHVQGGDQPDFWRPVQRVLPEMPMDEPPERDDFVFLELAAPLRFGLSATCWDRGLSFGDSVQLHGYRGTATRSYESHPTQLSSYDPKRQVWQLAAETAKGFSGGPVFIEEAGVFYLAGLTVSRERSEPKSGWIIPIAHVVGTLRGAVPSHPFLAGAGALDSEAPGAPTELSAEELGHARRERYARIREEQRNEIAAALSGAEAAWLRLRLCQTFGLDDRTTPVDLGKACESQSPDDLLETVEEVAENPPAGGRAVLARWVCALLPGVVGLRDRGEEVTESLVAGSPILVCSGYSNAIAECMAAAAMGRPADFVRDKNELDSVHRLEVDVTAMTGGAQAKEVIAAVTQTVASYAQRKQYRASQHQGILKRAMARATKKQAKRGERRYLVVFREDRVDAQFAEDFKAELEAAEIDLDVLFLRASEDDVILTIEAHMLETIAPLFDEAPP
ncbi:MAG: hypothetical protein RKU31_33255 [Deltaproteobacteria bacterium]